MAASRQFSTVTKRYLSCFYEILDNMIQEMTGAELCDSVSHNFIVQMIPHHRAAIEMSCNLLQYTTCVPLQNIASNIVEAQTKSIRDMEAVLGRCSCLKNTREERCCYQRGFEQISNTMFQNMADACATNDINANFIREMIPHHRGAIEMSENALCFPICPELVPILKAIIVSQKEGVRKMEQLLACI